MFGGRFGRWKINDNGSTSHPKSVGHENPDLLRECMYTTVIVGSPKHLGFPHVIFVLKEMNSLVYEPTHELELEFCSIQMGQGYTFHSIGWIIGMRIPFKNTPRIFWLDSCIHTFWRAKFESSDQRVEMKTLKTLKRIQYTLRVADFSDHPDDSV